MFLGGQAGARRAAKHPGVVRQIGRAVDVMPDFVGQNPPARRNHPVYWAAICGRLMKTLCSTRRIIAKLIVMPSCLSCSGEKE